MNIGIDARLMYETGVGRYIRNLIRELAAQDTDDTYVVFVSKEGAKKFHPPNARFRMVVADVAWHTFIEQVKMPGIFRNEHLDLLHIPYHNPPLLYRGPMVVTIHDLIILHFATGKATKLPYLLYLVKRLGYWIELFVGLRKARHVIAVSDTTKKEIVDHFHIPEKKISVTLEGVETGSPRGAPIISGPYYLYVGNAYPHKNLSVLLSAMKKIEKTLVLVGGPDYFYDSLMKEARGMKHIVFFGSANDQQLANLYTHADALVFPSLMEGFGLPALEALSMGCPVVVSDIPVFHEILGEQATYVDPHDPDAIVRALQSVHPTSVPDSFFRRYQWHTLAEQTQKIYKNCVT